MIRGDIWTKGLGLVLACSLLFQVGVMAQEATPGATPGSEQVAIDRSITFHPEDTGAGTIITVEVEPGEAETVDVIIGNSGEIVQTLRTYAIPALTGVNGGFVLADYGSESDDVTGWLEYPEQDFTFEPTEGERLSLVISVPSNALPGEYVTGLAAEQAEDYEVPGSDVFRQRTRWAIPILIVVPGDREPAFDLGDARLERFDNVVYATIEIANSGNVIVRPEGEVRLISSDGTVAGVARVEMGSVYTGTETTFIVAWEDAPLSDAYSLEVVMMNEEGELQVQKRVDGLIPSMDGDQATPVVDPLAFSRSELRPASTDSPPSLLLFNGEISNNGDPIENVRVAIVTYKDGEEVDRYPIMQAVTIQQGTTPIEARYSLPGGFTDGTYTFEVTIELGGSGTQTVLVTQPIDFEVTVP